MSDKKREVEIKPGQPSEPEVTPNRETEVEPHKQPSEHPQQPTKAPEVPSPDRPLPPQTPVKSSK